MNNYILYAILILTGLLGTYAIIPLFRSLLIESNVLRPNYKKDMIPVSMGIVFLPMLIINAIILAYFTTNFKDMLHIFIFLFGLVSMFFAGILDDIIGNRDVSGLKGHFKSLLNGKLTTGGFKALFGGFIGLVISIVLLFTLGEYTRNLLLLIFPNVIAYFNQDLKAKAMMGDTGSNVLGISIGILFVMGYPLKVRLIWLAFLIFIHILTEKYSLTKIIENNKFLNFIDKLGR